MFQRKLLKNLDWMFIGLLCLMMAVSLVVLKSASANVVAGQPYYYVKKQMLWILVGFLAMLLTASFNYSFLMRVANYIYVANIAILLAVFAFGFEAKGAQRWISLGFFDLQPSEFAKIAIVISFAAFLSRRQEHLNTVSDVLLCFLHIGIPLLLILKQPDLGTSLVLLAIMLGMMLVAGVNRKLMITLVAAIFLMVIIIFGVLFVATDGFQKPAEEFPVPLPLQPYQLMRLIIFVNPDMDPLGSGYHVIQSKVAIGSGHLFGKGLGNGSQVQGNFLPEHHTDFIFSVVGEELGFLGSSMVLLLFFLIVYRMMKIAGEARDIFGTLIVVGVASMLSFHILVNVGMTIGIMPVTGLPLPFLTYGGSGMLANMIAMGLVLNVNLRKENLLF